MPAKYRQEYLEHNHSSVNLKLLLRIANVFDCQLEILLDSQAATNWGREKELKVTDKQEAYTLEEMRQLLQLLRVQKNILF